MVGWEWCPHPFHDQDSSLPSRPADAADFLPSYLNIFVPEILICHGQLHAKHDSDRTPSTTGGFTLQNSPGGAVRTTWANHPAALRP